MVHPIGFSHPSFFRRLRRTLASLAAPLALLVASVHADITEEWATTLPIGTGLSAGVLGMVVDPSGFTYLTGITGSSSNTDVLINAIRPDGTLAWSQIWNGPTNGHDQGRALALGPAGVLYVVGNTPDAMSYSNILILKYDAATGALLNTIQYSSSPGTSEFAGSVVVDAQGNVYVAGGTVGDGLDVLFLKFDSAGALQWTQTWDGPAFAPYSQDAPVTMRLSPSGEPIVLINGVMSTQHSDYVVVKLAPSTGAITWVANWGVNGQDSPRDMEVDTAGDIYVTGTGFNLQNQYSTIKLRGTDGQLLWQAYDTAGTRNTAAGLALDHQGGVYVTGSSDPDADASNNNDNMFTVKRDATTGNLLWTHLYGLNCIGCADVASDVIADNAGHVFVSGSTNSPPYSADAITFVLDPATGGETTRGVLASAPGMSAEAGFLRLDANQDLFVGGRLRNTSTAVSEILVIKYPGLNGGAGVPFCSGDGSGAACPCGNLSIGVEGCQSSLGVGGRLVASGVSSLASDSVVLRGTQMPQSSVLYFQGTTRQAGGAGSAFGDGLRCAGGTVVRLGAKLNAGGGSQYPEAGDASVSAKGAVGVPGVRTYQCWFRNAAAYCTPSTFNLTNGWEITWSS